jgi:hypothetical protein
MIIGSIKNTFIVSSSSYVKIPATA